MKPANKKEGRFLRQEEYTKFMDEELICLVRQGEDGAVDFLMDKYKNMVRGKAKTLFLIGGDHDDLIQEGMIGLFRAIRDFDETRTEGFAGFASLCVSRQIYKAIQAQNRKKNQPLNNYISLYAPAFEGNGQEETKLMDVLHPDAASNPEQFVIDKESVGQLEEGLYARLSAMERQVLDLFLEGYTYQDIAASMQREPKAIDNALQRIKSKLNQVLQEVQG